MSRTKDKIVSVRTAAVSGLERLQGQEEDDYVVPALLFLLKSDPNKYVLAFFLLLIASEKLESRCWVPCCSIP